jgi:outer membrane protein assembly factor BamB
MAGMARDRIYIGAKGHVVGLEAASGRELWRTKLRGMGFVTTGLVEERVIAATGGHLYGLDPSTGSILWHNELKGLGLGLVSLAGLDGGSSFEAAAIKTEQQRRNAAAAG